MKTPSLYLPFGPGPVGVTIVGFGPKGREESMSPFLAKTGFMEPLLEPSLENIVFFFCFFFCFVFF